MPGAVRVIVKLLVIVPLLRFARHLLRLGFKMGIGASLPERLVKAVEKNDANGLSEVGHSLLCAEPDYVSSACSSVFALVLRK